MKKNLLALCCGILSLSAAAQMPYISTPTIMPQNPTASSFIKVAVKVTTPNQGIIVDANTFTVTGQQITIKGCYWQGMATAIQEYPDTIMIGQLPAGNYAVTQWAYLSSTQQHCTATDTNMVTTAIQVTGTVATFLDKKDHADLFNVYFNPSSEALHFSGLREAGTAFVFSAGGALVRKIEAVENRPVIISDLANGLYFVRLENTGNTTRFIKYSSE